MDVEFAVGADAYQAIVAASTGAVVANAYTESANLAATLLGQCLLLVPAEGALALV